jgi:hypothetical protein
MLDRLAEFLEDAINLNHATRGRRRVNAMRLNETAEKATRVSSLRDQDPARTRDSTSAEREPSQGCLIILPTEWGA